MSVHIKHDFYLSKRLKFITLLLSAGVLLLGPVVMATQLVRAQSNNSSVADEGLSLQVSPSPLITTVKPGVSTTLDLRIRNTGTTSQDLKMGMRAFTVSETSGEVKLQKEAPAEIARFVRYEKPTFTVGAGEIYTQRVVIDTPASAGFTYSFATTVSQQNPAKAEKGTTSIRGTVAVFTLINVDKPGANRKLDISQLSIGKRVYEYLPADLTLTLKNSGNTLAQPKGTIFIQHHSDDTKPLAAIQLNEAGGFILPNTSRQLQASWKSGFPRYETTSEDGQAPQRKLVWPGSDISDFRFGRYVAKVVAVYDDGQRDVPLTAEVTFWVIPWRILLIVAVVLLLIVVGVVTTLRKSTKALKITKRHHKKPAKHDAPLE